MVPVDIVGRVREVVCPVLEVASLQLVDVRLLVERGRRILRLYIDKPGGVTLGDCSEVSREVSNLLDLHDFIPYRYTLEVSSPGLDRPLHQASDFRRSVGRLVQVTVRRSSSGTRTLVGILASCDQEGINLEVDGKEVFIHQHDIAKAKLKPKF